MANEKLVIIDGNSLVNRAFYALPPLTNAQGIHTNGVFGFLTMFYKILEDEKPTHMVVAFDKKGKTFRHEEYKEYKGTRKGMPSELAEQMPILKEVLDALGIKRLECEGYEADDIIGTLSKNSSNSQIETVIFTGDKDALQLVDDKVRVMISRKGITETEKFNPQALMEKYGVTPAQFIDIKGLMGDTSDNIPGVEGVGEKTAIKLITSYGSIEGIYENIEDVKGEKLKQRLIENKDMAFLSKRLATIVTDMALDVDNSAMKITEGDRQKLYTLYSDLGFKSLLDKISTNAEQELQPNKTIDYYTQTASLDQIIIAAQQSTKNKPMAFKILFNQDDKIQPVALAFCIDDKTLYHRFEKPEDINLLKDIFEDDKILKSSHDVKEEIVALRNMGIKLRGIVHDSMIAAYLINPTLSDYSLNAIASQYCAMDVPSEEQLLGKGKGKQSYDLLSDEDLKNYLCSACYSIYLGYESLKSKLQEDNLYSLYMDVEVPLIEALADMEYLGFKVDKGELLRLSEDFSVIIENLTREIYNLSGEEFNINSPKQLGYILFDKLNLPAVKKTKTGYSTNAEVLSDLENMHDIIPKILEYRQMVKLKSTYVDGLLAVINKDTNKIHSKFNQTVTATGRISSTEPNLQNIPIKVEMGRKIRKVFIPSNEDFLLLDGDYSQIELRVLAHISGDQNLIDAFKNGEDIHTNTASRVFGVPKEEVTSIMRSRAKAVNFGIVYGISDFGLSRDLGISRKEAQRYIDNYFEKYPMVKKYMDDIVEMGKNQGYVTTLLGRRRPLTELASKNYNIRSFGERIAMNTPIQGSAADIIKLAMVRVYNKLKNSNLKSRVILQVHDELIVETHIDELEFVKGIVKEEMEKALEMQVPLEVDLRTGKSWYDTK